MLCRQPQVNQGNTELACVFDHPQRCLGNDKRKCLKEKSFYNGSKCVMFALLSECCTLRKSCHNLSGLSFKADWAATELEEAGTRAGEAK